MVGDTLASHCPGISHEALAAGEKDPTVGPRVRVEQASGLSPRPLSKVAWNSVGTRSRILEGTVIGLEGTVIGLAGTVMGH
jgi:hypothetical protein